MPTVKKELALPHTPPFGKGSSLSHHRRIRTIGGEKRKLDGKGRG